MPAWNSTCRIWRQSGADGIGLFRTELQFMIGETMPRLADQSAFYKKILDAAGDKPVVFRTLDLGGDKVLPYARWEREENPALGWRAIRIALDRPALLRYQVRALLNAGAGRTLRILLPMVSDVDEFNRGRALIDRETGARPAARTWCGPPRCWWAPCWKCRRWPSCCRS